MNLEFLLPRALGWNLDVLIFGLKVQVTDFTHGLDFCKLLI
jgi:hypothetical protein